MLNSLPSPVGLLAQAPQAPFDRPAVDWHALAPEIVIVAIVAFGIFPGLLFDVTEPAVKAVMGG